MNGWWTITHDAQADETKPKASPTNAVTLCGPRECTLSFDEILRHPDAKKFQMLDDDGNLYYQGVCVLPEGLGDEAFRPLDDFGLPNAGATSIQYRNEERGEWETL